MPSCASKIHRASGSGQRKHSTIMHIACSHGISFERRRFRKIFFQAHVVLKLLVYTTYMQPCSLFCQNKCRHTHTHTYVPKYCNPHCACAWRVNENTCREYHKHTVITCQYDCIVGRALITTKVSWVAMQPRAPLLFSSEKRVVLGVVDLFALHRSVQLTDAVG